MFGLLGTDYEDPKTQGTLALALSMLANSGPSVMPKSFGQILGASGMAGMEQYSKRKKEKLLEDESKRRDEEAKANALLRQMQERKIREELEAPAQLAQFYRNPDNISKMVSRPAEGDPYEAFSVQERKPLSKGEQLHKMLLSESPVMQRIAATRLAKDEEDPYINAGGGALFNRQTGKWEVAPKQNDDNEEKDTFIRRMKAAGIDPASPQGQQLLSRWLNKEVTRPANEQLAIKVESQRDARGRVSDTVLRLRDAYDALDAAGGAVKAGQSPAENAINTAMNTMPGQIAGRVLGTRAQIERDRIATMRPALINEIRQATGMSARAMDSNVELQFYLKMATDTGVDPEVNKSALEYIDANYGTNFGISGSPTGRAKLNQLREGSSGKGLSVGHVVNGYRYKGGNPNDPSSWEPVK